MKSVFARLHKTLRQLRRPGSDDFIAQILHEEIVKVTQISIHGLKGAVGLYAFDLQAQKKLNPAAQVGRQLLEIVERSFPRKVM